MVNTKLARCLSAHTSCVNALAISPDGRWLASGGDADPCILLWDFHQDDLLAPSEGLRGPRANVFALTFSPSGRHLVSGDASNGVLKYDLHGLSTTSIELMLPTESYMTHSNSIRAVSFHPQSDDVFLSASEDGRIVMHDSRSDQRMSRAQSTVQKATEFTGCQFHPEAPGIFLTSEANGQVCLRDTRMAFGPLNSRSNDGIVQQASQELFLSYVTKIGKPKVSYVTQPDASSAVFDRTGTKFAITFRGYLPTIYSIDDPNPVATCFARYLPDGTPVPPGKRTYANTSTMKHGSFGGPGLDRDEYYSAGSEDFCGYVWEIPEVQTLKQRREIVSDTSFYGRDPATVGEADSLALIITEYLISSGFASNSGGERCIPVELHTPLSRLGGHRSIVNTTLFHPNWPFVLTAGVERHIMLHSASSNTPCAVDLTPTTKEVRDLPEPSVLDRQRALEASTAGPLIPRPWPELDDSDDSRTIALFDEILRREQDFDVFRSRMLYGLDDDYYSMFGDGHAHMDDDSDDAMYLT
ncbi:WD40 repeat-like protein [Trametopsis cervina]|nr:WD40 repeat-like protein [Trametopsis cervina]